MLPGRKCSIGSFLLKKDEEKYWLMFTSMFNRRILIFLSPNRFGVKKSILSLYIVVMESAYLLMRYLSRVTHVASVADIAVATAYHRRVFSSDMYGTNLQIRSSTIIVSIVNILTFNVLPFLKPELYIFVFDLH